MSSETYAYGVDLTKLGEYVGCGDAAKLAEVEGLVGTDELDRDFGFDTTVTHRQALRSLVLGEPMEHRSANALRLYALEHLCGVLGKKLDGEGHVGYPDDLDWETRILQRRVPLGLARPDDFPDTSHLTAEEVRDECERFADDTEHDDPSIEAGREEFAWWLEQCRREGLAMVTFQY
jgi:hypothetical protein